jgi:intron-binding protein aquarius
VAEDVAHSCETAAHFHLHTVLARWEHFVSEAKRIKEPAEALHFIANQFPFLRFFNSAGDAAMAVDGEQQPAAPALFAGKDVRDDLDTATSCFRSIQHIFEELHETLPFELLRAFKDRGNYLLTNHARVIAMTCTHAAIKRSELVALGFQFDNLVMEEAAQVLDIETFIP